MTIRDQTGGHAPPLCLEAGIFDGLKSRPSFFDKHFQTSTAEALELCRTLNVLRRMGIQDHQTSQIALYLQKAKYVTESQEEESGISPEAVRAMECHWTSPCSGSGDRYHTLVGLKTDMHMALFMMAAGMMKEAGSRSAVVLQQQQEDAEAEAELAALMGGEAEPEAATGSSSSGGGGVDELQECVKLLQKAAGVFRHLSHDLLPQLTDLPTNHPAELSTELADAMHIAALACSHAVAAHRACEFLGKTPELAAMLYAGASDMFERAATKVSALRSTKMEVGTNFRKYLAVSSAYYHARAYEYHGVAQCSSDDVGSGCASITEALRRLEECRSAVDDHREWKDAIQKAVSHAASLKQQYNEDRQLLHFQPEAAAAKKLPPARNFIQPQSFCLDSLRDWFSNADFMPGAV